jgi:hypothetical protein
MILKKLKKICLTLYFCCRLQKHHHHNGQSSPKKSLLIIFVIIINQIIPNRRKCDVYQDDSGMDHEQMLMTLPPNVTIKRLLPYLNDIAAAISNKTINSSYLFKDS